jgi:cysteinyl-tRNA synthetase
VRDEAPPEVVALAVQRQAARAAKDFAEADRQLDAIAELGWEVRDEAGGFELVRL